MWPMSCFVDDHSRGSRSFESQGGIQSWLCCFRGYGYIYGRVGCDVGLISTNGKSLDLRGLPHVKLGTPLEHMNAALSESECMLVSGKLGSCCSVLTLLTGPKSSLASWHEIRDVCSKDCHYIAPMVT